MSPLLDESLLTSPLFAFISELVLIAFHSVLMDVISMFAHWHLLHSSTKCEGGQPRPFYEDPLDLGSGRRSQTASLSWKHIPIRMASHSATKHSRLVLEIQSDGKRTVSSRQQIVDMRASCPHTRPSLDLDHALISCQ
ncbi:unnamed protein product [Lota lota]